MEAQIFHGTKSQDLIGTSENSIDGQELNALTSALILSLNLCRTCSHTEQDAAHVEMTLKHFGF
jgi:hypothetical protein